MQTAPGVTFAADPVQQRIGTQPQRGVQLAGLELAPEEVLDRQATDGRAKLVQALAHATFGSLLGIVINEDGVVVVAGALSAGCELMKVGGIMVLIHVAMAALPGGLRAIHRQSLRACGDAD